MPSILKLTDGRTVYVREDLYASEDLLLSSAKILYFHDQRTNEIRRILRAHIVELSPDSA